MSYVPAHVIPLETKVTTVDGVSIPLALEMVWELKFTQNTYSFLQATENIIMLVNWYVYSLEVKIKSSCIVR